MPPTSHNFTGVKEMAIRTGIVSAILVTISFVFANSEPPPELHDPFLDKFIGDWRVERKMGNGKTSESAVHAEWVLKHHFIRLEYGRGEATPKYEAIVFIGYDDGEQNYVCHWVDIFGARYSALGRGKLSDDKQSLEFRFDSKEGGLTNKFAFDSQANTWTSLIRQEENGEWKTFAEEKWTRTGTQK
jgi:Protein of unknown function (DUF1579)